MEKTKPEEILDSVLENDDAYWLSKEYLGKWYPTLKDGILKAMEEYGNLRYKEGQEEFRKKAKEDILVLQDSRREQNRKRGKFDAFNGKILIDGIIQGHHECLEALKKI
jgi:hypothetical protein